MHDQNDIIDILCEWNSYKSKQVFILRFNFNVAVRFTQTNKKTEVKKLSELSLIRGNR